MKNKISLLLILVSFSLAAQSGFSYRRQLSYKQCSNCDCKKARSYKIISKNLSSSQRTCAQNDINATLMVKEMFQSGTDGGLFAAYNLPQEGCGDDCYHEFENISDDIETIYLDECLTENQKQKIKEQQERTELEKKNKINDLLTSAKYEYNKEYLRNALSYYKDILALDPNNYEAYNKKIEIENFFSARAYGYQYRTLFDGSFMTFQERLKGVLNDEISKSEKGQCKFSIEISFDTNGMNNSIIGKTNIVDLDNKIASLVNTWLSSKPMKKGYYVKSFDKITVDLSWYSGNSIYTRNSKGSTIQNAIGSTEDHYKFIKSLDYPYGTFYFTSKAKKLILNGTETKATEILFTNYKFSGGPLNALYSILFPGIGKYKVTNGQKGKNTMLYSGILVLFEGIFKLYEIQAKNDYYNDTNPAQAEDNYRAANISRQMGLLTLISILGMGTYDVCHSIITGMQNKNKAKSTKILIRYNSPYLVQDTKLN
jgi:hypothetical protein